MAEPGVVLDQKSGQPGEVEDGLVLFSFVFADLLLLHRIADLVSTATAIEFHRARRSESVHPWSSSFRCLPIAFALRLGIAGRRRARARGAHDRLRGTPPEHEPTSVKGIRLVERAPSRLTRCVTEVIAAGGVLSCPGRAA